MPIHSLSFPPLALQIGKGAKSWEGFARDEKARGPEKDQGVRLIKSGTDFRDLSEVMLELEDQPEGSVRRKIIKNLTGRSEFAHESHSKLIL